MQLMVSLPPGAARVPDLLLGSAVAGLPFPSLFWLLGREVSFTWPLPLSLVLGVLSGFSRQPVLCSASSVLLLCSLFRFLASKCSRSDMVAWPSWPVPRVMQWSLPLTGTTCPDCDPGQLSVSLCALRITVPSIAKRRCESCQVPRFIRPSRRSCPVRDGGLFWIASPVGQCESSVKVGSSVLC